MTKKEHDKEYQLWVWYHVQNGDNPQNGYSLALETDNPNELFLKVAALDPEDEYMTTQKISMKVQVI